MRVFIGFLRIFVGILFMISGFVKLVDPIGFSFKLDEYFSEAVFNLPFLIDYSIYISLFIVILEVLLGFLLILGIYKNLALFSLFFLIVYFTFLTFYSAYFNKVTDCGCFGDALKLTPWQSFGKDLVILVLVTVLLFYKKHIQPLFNKSVSIGLLFIIAIWSFFIPYRGIMGLPIFDFRAYKEGINLKTEIKKEGKPDIYTLFYKLENQETKQVISVSDSLYINNQEYWEEGSPWTITETNRKLLKKGTPPPIKDFDIDCGKEGIKTEFYLDEPYLVVFTSYGEKYYSKYGAEKLAILRKDLEKMDIGVLALGLPEEYGPICNMDATTIKTINRSNPGILLLHNGIILKKYHWSSVPNAQGIADQFKGKRIN